MALKASQLYGKIAEALKILRTTAWEPYARMQEAMLDEGRFTPLGDLLIEHEVVDAETNRQILRQHKLTNILADEKILGDWLAQKGYATAEAIDDASKSTRLAVRRGQTQRIPRTISQLMKADRIDAPREVMVAVNDKVLVPLHEMTRYFVHVVQPDSVEVTLGRLAFQLQHVSREDLFAVLIARVDGGPASTRLLDALRTREVLSSPAESSIRDLIRRLQLVD